MQERKLLTYPQSSLALIMMCDQKHHILYNVCMDDELVHYAHRYSFGLIKTRKQTELCLIVLPIVLAALLGYAANRIFFWKQQPPEAVGIKSHTFKPPQQRTQ
jgi:hypothetical protein